MSDKLTRGEIVAALLALEAECAKRGIGGEICICVSGLAKGSALEKGGKDDS